MAIRMCFLLVIIGYCISTPLNSQTFRCDGRLILGTNTPDLTQVYIVDFGAFGAIGYTPISFYPDLAFDALGFNSRDNYIYAVQNSTNTVVRLQTGGNFESLGSPPGIAQLEVYAGDCTPAGQYICHDNTLDQLLVFDVVDDFTLVDQIDLFWDPTSVNSGSFTTRIDDFAIDPNNPTTAYAFQAIDNGNPDLLPLATAGYLLRINLDLGSPDVGMVTPVGELTPVLNVSRMGSLFFNDFGSLFGYAAQGEGADLPEKRLVSINPFTAEATYQGLGSPSAPITDGCSCPYSLKVNYMVSPLVATCTDDEVTYTLTINNLSYEALSGVTLLDTLAPGMVIEALEGGLPGNINPTTGVGTRFLTITNLQIPARGTLEMSIDARVVDVPVGNVESQVRLTDLPPPFVGDVLSDDPSTTSRNDPAIFAADGRLLDNVTLDITPPTDCLADNDGQVTVSSPLFLPGVTYQVGLLNQDWEPFLRNPTANGSNAFFLDSLPAGEYRLDDVVPQNLLCGYEWKDTTIIIEAPNDQLQAEVETNSPICAGEDLRIEAVLVPGGDVLWRGPLFINIGTSLAWDNVDTTYAGTYEMTATYGSCEQIRETEVIVRPVIVAEIGGDTTYCEREQLQLIAGAVGDSLLSFQWSGPDGLTNNNRRVKLSSTAPTDAGIYQVIVDNAACQDTATVEVVILPSPTIELPRLIESDFCDPVLLQPIITGDDNVSYRWSPAEGLSCADCPTPELQFPILPDYQLNVINDFSCTDSTNVRVFFRGDDLIYIPNAFSPNFDGVNDHFQFFPSCAVRFLHRIEVYDRWGNQVFATGLIDNPDDASAFWDGRVNGKLAAAGVYLWQAEIELINGDKRTLRGEVSLL